MDRKEQILKRLREIAASGGPKVTMLATVKDVNEAESTCTLYDEDTELDYHEVRLRPVIDSKESFTLVPKIGTWALAVRIEDEDEWMIVGVGEADKWKLKCDNVEFNGGLNGGLIKIQELVNDINSVKTDINNLKTAIAGWSPVANDGGAALKLAVTTWYGSQLTATQKATLENTKVKH